MVRGVNPVRATDACRRFEKAALNSNDEIKEIIKMRKVFALVLVLILALTTAAYADSTARTLDEIKDSGEIVIGVFSDKKPFGYVDENGEYQGYDVFFAKRLAEDLGVTLKLVSVDAPNRVEYLTSAKVDVILANFTGNA